MKRMLSALAVFLITSRAFAQSPPLTNWSAPAGFRPSHRGITTQSAAPFIAITPCRQYDSRTSGGPLADNTPRTVALGGAPCNILSSGIVAVSLNITVFAITGATGNGVFKVGDVSPPTTAWINYPNFETQRANAGAMSVDNSTQIAVQVNQGGGSVQFTVDVNGYYANDVTGTTGQDTFLFKSANNGAGGFGVMRVENTATTGANAHAITARINSQTDGAAAIHAQALASAGNVFGVKGVSMSPSHGSAGVKGVGHYGDPVGDNNFCDACNSAGVLGVDSAYFGVLGVTDNGGLAGVGGVALTANHQGVLAEGFLGSDLGSPLGVYYAGGLGGSGTKSFFEPHPTDPSKAIRYICLEGPEAGTYFRGSSRTLRGRAVIDVPEDFRMVSAEEGMTVQLTPVGSLATLAVESQDLNRIVVLSSKEVAFHYLVQSVRRAYRDKNPIVENHYFRPRRPTDRIPAYLSDDERQRVIANGTYNQDGTVNTETARRLGWEKDWEAREHPLPEPKRD